MEEVVAMMSVGGRACQWKINRKVGLKTALPALHALLSNIWRLEAGGAA